MKPCKLASPTFAVTAAILGGIALASTTCQSEAAVLDLSDERLRVPPLLRFGSLHEAALTPRDRIHLVRFRAVEASSCQFLTISTSPNLPTWSSSQSAPLPFFATASKVPWSWNWTPPNSGDVKNAG
jgi:hypothetical protein